MINKRRLIAAGAGLAAAIGVGLWRVAPLRDVPRTNAAPDYDVALVRLADLQALDDAAVQAVCRTRLLDHGHSTARAVVLLHGFTNCPAQYVELAARLHARGDNVLIPRLPAHGYDRLSADSRWLTAEGLLQTTSAAVDIACGLGEEVTVFGLSMGGVLAVWAALKRPDVARVVVASPALGTQAFPGEVRARMAANFMRTAPNFFRWWDGELREKNPNPAHQYARISSRAFAQLLRLGLLVRREARAKNPVAGKVTVVFNPADDAVDNEIAETIVAGWQHRGADVTVYRFAPEMQLLHDIIDPAQPDQRVAEIYPVLLELM